MGTGAGAGNCMKPAKTALRCTQQSGTPSTISTKLVEQHRSPMRFSLIPPPLNVRTGAAQIGS